MNTSDGQTSNLLNGPTGQKGQNMAQTNFPIEGLTFGGEKYGGKPITLPEVVSVRAVHVGKKKHFQYLGLLADGTEIVLRKKSTQLKPFAHYFNEAVASGVEGVPAHFSYSNAITNPKKNIARIAVFAVAPPL